MNKKDQESCPEQLEELRKEFSEFVYIVSHDLKAPIRAINNLSDWIEEDLKGMVSEDVLHNLSLLRNRATRLEQMIEALLKYSRINSTNIDLAEANVQELIKTASENVKGKERLTVEVENALPELVTSKDKLLFIFEQLLQNSLTFSDKAETIVYISCTNSLEFYEFVVADNGSGVPEEALEKIFKLFYTIAPKDSVNTTGAGLTIARKVVNLLGCDMWASGNNYGGLSVHFTWPKNITL